MGFTPLFYFLHFLFIITEVSGGINVSYVKKIYSDSGKRGNPERETVNRTSTVSNLTGSL